jgi:hypothetical protein
VVDDIKDALYEDIRISSDFWEGGGGEWGKKLKQEIM